ncbi:MAG: hypothetical protein ABIO94_01070 [Opitutaceae bacterium]
MGLIHVIFNLLPSEGWVGGTKLPNDGKLLCAAIEKLFIAELAGAGDLGEVEKILRIFLNKPYTDQKLRDRVQKVVTCVEQITRRQVTLEIKP